MTAKDDVNYDNDILVKLNRLMRPTDTLNDQWSEMIDKDDINCDMDTTTDKRQKNVENFDGREEKLQHKMNKRTVTITKLEYKSNVIYIVKSSNGIV